MARASCLALICALALLLPSPGALAGDPRGDDGPILDIEDHTQYPEFPDPPAGAPDARLRVVFDLVSRATEVSVEPNVPFDFWVIAHDVQVALRAWEGSLQIDPRILVLEREIPGLNLGTGNDVRAAFKPANCLSGPTVTLARFRGMVTEPGLTDLVIGLGPVSTQPSLDPPVPCYLVCRPGKDLRPFDACETCAVANPQSVRPETDEAEASPLRDILAPARGRN